MKKIGFLTNKLARKSLVLTFFAAPLTAIAIVATQGVTLYQTIAGPLSSTVRTVSKITGTFRQQSQASLNANRLKVITDNHKVFHPCPGTGVTGTFGPNSNVVSYQTLYSATDKLAEYCDTYRSIGSSTRQLVLRLPIREWMKAAADHILS